MRQHDNSRFLRLDLVNRLKVVHVADTVDDRIDLSGKSVTMPHSALLSSEFYLPARVEEVGARKYNVGMVKDEHRSHTCQRDERVPDKGRIE